jgi:hypothetical protein
MNQTIPPFPTDYRHGPALARNLQIKARATTV